MAQKGDDHSASPLCLLCGMSMTPVLIEPPVASFSELHTFRCFACGDVRAVEQQQNQHIGAAVAQAKWPAPPTFSSISRQLMNQAGMPHPDYYSLQNVLNSVAQWITRYREARRGHDQLKNCSVDDVAAMARDLRMSTGELVALSKKGPNAADLLQKLLIALGVDPEGLSDADPLITRDLQRLCITCGYKRQCKRDLECGKAVENFHNYCPNAFMLDALLKAKQ